MVPHCQPVVGVVAVGAQAQADAAAGLERRGPGPGRGSGCWWTPPWRSWALSGGVVRREKVRSELSRKSKAPRAASSWASATSMAMRSRRRSALPLTARSMACFSVSGCSAAGAAARGDQRPARDRGVAGGERQAAKLAVSGARTGGGAGVGLSHECFSPEGNEAGGVGGGRGIAALSGVEPGRRAGYDPRRRAEGKSHICRSAPGAPSGPRRRRRSAAFRPLGRTCSDLAWWPVISAARPGPENTRARTARSPRPAAAPPRRRRRPQRHRAHPPIAHRPCPAGTSRATNSTRASLRRT